MPEITIQELQNKYPMIYPVVKSAEEFGEARIVLKEQMKQVIEKYKNGASPEEMKELMLMIAIMHGVIQESLKIVAHATKSYEVILATLNKYVIPEQ